MTKCIDVLNGIVWGVPALFLMVFVGLLLSIRTRWVQFRLLPQAFQTLILSLLKKNGRGNASQYKALCTALAATVGTGNIAGVAGAIALGGPGSIFWMWICAFLGMATKYAEAILASRYQKKANDGHLFGGPMYVAEYALGKPGKIFAVVYAFFGVVASLGVGAATQVNAMLGGINYVVMALGGTDSFVRNVLVGIIVSVFSVCTLSGGFKKVGNISTVLVPFASLFYIVICLFVLICRVDVIADVFLTIFRCAFNPEAIGGGLFISVLQTIRIGASRGVFTNEAGMGTAGIAHSSASVEHPVEQGMMGILEVFLDTVVICTLTALVILCSGIAIPYGRDLGIQITIDAFSNVYGDWISIPIAFALSFFAIATILGWGYYGVCFARYLFGNSACLHFVFLQAASIIAGSIFSTGTVWALSELSNGCMAIPNLIILIILNKEVINMTKNYFFTYSS